MLLAVIFVEPMAHPVALFQCSVFSMTLPVMLIEEAAKGKDTCNKKNNMQNLGATKSSNLCTEIIYTSLAETVVCNINCFSSTCKREGCRRLIPNIKAFRPLTLIIIQLRLQEGQIYGTVLLVLECRVLQMPSYCLAWHLILLLTAE